MHTTKFTLNAIRTQSTVNTISNKAAKEVKGGIGGTTSLVIVGG